ncbi:MAG: UbiA family prenyltransferase [Chloroflexi bacterium]|nr:UbiA family prenyltransferase [Chloroflexota bacterium]
MNSKKIKGLIRLFRPDLSLAAGLCTVGGQIISTGHLASWPVTLLGFLCAFGCSGAALVVNDYFDFEVDKVNAPERPLPSGAVTRQEAVLLGVFISLLGLIPALFLGPVCFIFTLFFWVIGFLYNWRYKESGLPGNLMVSSSVAFTFILGAMTVGQPWNTLVWVFALMAFFIDLGEEITGDALDLEGDQQRGARSIARSMGKPFALRAAVVMWGLVILLGWIPVISGLMGAIYGLTILAVDTVIIYFSLRLLRTDDVSTQRKCMKGIYIGATLVVLAFLIGQVTI